MVPSLPAPPPPPPPKLPPTYGNETQPHSQAVAPHLSNDPQPQMHHQESAFSQDLHQYTKPSINQEQTEGSASETTSPRSRWQDGSTTHPQSSNPYSTFAVQNSDVDRFHIGQLLHQSSVSPVGPDDIRWVPETNQWESRTPYIPSPRLDHLDPSQELRTQNTSITQSPSAANPMNQQDSSASQTLPLKPIPQTSQISISHDGVRVQDDNSQEPNSSFYWHSPHSSSDTTNEHSQSFSGPITPLNTTSTSQVPPLSTSAIEQAHSSTYSQTTNMYHSDLGLYSSSALGFGGPSDWEHFGDYEAEEVDDTDLYSRAEPPINVPVSADFAELPAGSPPYTGMQQQMPTGIVDTPSAAHMSAPLSTDSLKLEEGPLAAEPGGNREATEEGSYQTMANNSQMQAQVPPPNTTENPGSQPDCSSHDTQKVEAAMGDIIHAWSYAPGPQAPGASSPASSDHSSQIQPTNEVHTPMQSDLSRPSSKPESPLRHTGRPLKGLSEKLVNTIEKQEPGQDILSSENQVSLTDTGCLGPRQVSGVQEDSLQAIPPLRVGSPLVPKGSRDQVTSQDTGANGTTRSPSPGNPDQTSLKEESLKASEEDARRHLVVATSPGFPSKNIEARDPYANLDPWAKASLNRYVTMLREEAGAESDKDKFKIFEVFINRETRLRAVLYGTDAESPAQKSVPLKEAPAKRTITTNLPAVSKALPALPTNADSSPCKPLTVTIAHDGPKSDTASVQDQASNLSTGDQSYVMVESSGDVQYSPGGRPVVPRASNANQNGDTGSGKHKGDSEAPKPAGSDETSSVQKPAYTPFRYSQPDATDLSTKRQSYRPYAALKIGSLGVGPSTSNVTEDPRTSEIDFSEKILVGSGKNDGDTATNYLSGMDAPTLQRNNQEPLDLRRFEKADFDPLVSVLPRSGFVPQESISLQELKRGMDAVPDDFSFIHQSVIAWDARAKKLRENHEKARHARQVESEQRIDALFDGHEIGYGDISELESEFKQSEAATKTDEDRLEYRTFVTGVFDLVWTRLHFEIDQLTPLYTHYTNLLNDTLAGKDMFDGPSTQFALAPTMDSLITLHQKLEVRHQKAFEAVLERDRRLKKTELSPWYSLGNVTKVKQLEKQFEKAEKNAIVEYCHQRDIRANKLMDALDQNTLRGVGANQDYMELVHRAVCRVASQRAFASAPNSKEPEVGLDEVTKAKMVTAALATSSEQIVQTFHVADMLLNVADYEVSVATAKLTNADVATFKKLGEEKAKEDHKLMRDLEHRLALIREDSRRTNDEIVKLLCFLGVQNGHAEISQRVSGSADPGHQERLQKALEEAKRRNATKETLV